MDIEREELVEITGVGGLRMGEVSGALGWEWRGQWLSCGCLPSSKVVDDFLHFGECFSLAHGLSSFFLLILIDPEKVAIERFVD